MLMATENTSMNVKPHPPLPLVTADELLAMGRGRRELIRGEVIEMTPAGSEHGRIALTIAAHLWNWVMPRGLGTVHGADTGFVLQRGPDTVRAPDAAFIQAAHVVKTPKFHPGAPDLAVEVLSPDDRPSELRARIHDYFGAGTIEIWVVSPKSRTVTVHRANAEPRTLREPDALICEDLLPGFRLALRDLFA